MALINPVHGLVVPFLCIFTIPLAILAGITSALAFSVLIFRVAVVYLDIALALVPQYFKGKSKPALYPPDKRRYSRRDEWKTPSSPPGSTGSYSGYGTQSPTAPFPQATGLLGSGYISPHRRKSSYGFGYALNRKSHQSSSQVSLGSVGTISPIHEDEVSNDITPAVPASEVPAPSVGLDRDFEGVGGWRLDDGKDDCDEWIKINSRLELPLEWSSFSRHSQRSQSVGPMTHGEGSWLMMRNSFGKESFVVDEFPRETRERRFSMGATKGSSPNSSRLRMNQIQPPTFTTLDSENYFFHADRSTPKSPKKTSFV